MITAGGIWLPTTQAPKSTIPLLKVLRIYSFQQCQDLHYCQDLWRDQGIAASRDLHSWDEAVNFVSRDICVIGMTRRGQGTSITSDTVDYQDLLMRLGVCQIKAREMNCLRCEGRDLAGLGRESQGTLDVSD